MVWQRPAVSSRPIVVLGTGTLGRRIACVFAAGGYDVHIYDLSAECRQAGLSYVSTHGDEFNDVLLQEPRNHGVCKAFESLDEAVKDAWLVIEAVPEKLELKIDVFGQLDAKCPADCIFGSNSSSFKSSLMVDKVSEQRRALVCNIHFTMPPEICTVELMTDGHTNPEVFPFLTEVLQLCGMLPVTAAKESTGFIFNRLWAAIKREILTILAEGVSNPSQVDLLWKNMFKTEVLPCKLMDQIGLDTVAFIEDNYIQERKLNPALTAGWLRENYLSQGKTGDKSAKGGLYPPAATNGCNSSYSESDTSLYVLDVGIGGNLESVDQVVTNGKVLRVDSRTGKSTPIITGLSMPDGIDVSESEGRIFWTNMGSSTPSNDGSVQSSKLDGSDIKTLVSAGEIYTPKQLAIAEKSRKIYFSDREGMAVRRCDFDGKNHEVLVRRSSKTADMTQWCVGISVDEDARKMYWTQKGPSKASKGRIFRANLEISQGESADTRTDIELLFENLPEPIDLEIDPTTKALYWTDRGEHPTGSCLYRASVGGESVKKPEIVARHFHEPIGLKLDPRQRRTFVTDLGGSVYSVNTDTGEKKIVYQSNGSYTGITVV